MALINIDIKVKNLGGHCIKKEEKNPTNDIYIILSESDNDSTLYENTSTLSC